jgi:hypothetical protein
MKGDGADDTESPSKNPVIAQSKTRTRRHARWGGDIVLWTMITTLDRHAAPLPCFVSFDGTALQGRQKEAASGHFAFGIRTVFFVGVSQNARNHARATKYVG